MCRGVDLSNYDPVEEMDLISHMEQKLKVEYLDALYNKADPSERDTAAMGKVLKKYMLPWVVTQQQKNQQKEEDGLADWADNTLYDLTVSKNPNIPSVIRVKGKKPNEIKREHKS